MTTYRKRPIEVDTIQWTGDNEADVQAFTGGPSIFYALDDEDRANSDDPDATAAVYDKLHSTWVLVYTGQHVVRGVKGEYYPIAEDVLAETYEPAVVSAPVQPTTHADDERRERYAAALFEESNPGVRWVDMPAGLSDMDYWRKQADAVLAVADGEQRELASLAVNAANALRDERRHHEIAAGEVGRLRAELRRMAGEEQPTTETPFVPPAHYRGRDGTAYCVHAIPVGPDSCPECCELADDQPAVVARQDGATT
ncbi:hypothetical protein [Streptomyces sp. NPDC003857]